MSTQSASPRYQRSVAGMVGAMIVATVVAGGWYLLGRPDESVRPIATVKTADWHGWVNAGRKDGKLITFAPQRVPDGWRVTSANYQTGVAPHWHLGLLTPSDYVGLEESRDTTEHVVQQFVDENAVQGKDVTVDGTTWQTWTDSGGDYALIRTVAAPDGEQQRVLVYGSAPDQDIRDYAGSLSADPVS